MKITVRAKGTSNTGIVRARCWQGIGFTDHGKDNPLSTCGERIVCSRRSSTGFAYLFTFVVVVFWIAWLIFIYSELQIPHECHLLS